MKAKHTVGIYTLGCKVNQYESEAIAEELSRAGIEVVAAAEACDAYIINTCTVTAESDRKARQFIRRAISKNPDAYITVTGCMAQTQAQRICEIEGVDAVIGNSEKLEAARVTARLLAEGKQKTAPTVSVGDVESAPFEPMSIRAFGRTRAYVKIEDGCESRCTYCIIPSARGKIRSKPHDEVIAEVRALTEGGCREVVLTGIETASYGRDLEGTDLATLLEAVDRIEGIGRVRLGSLDPSLIKPEFVRRISALRSLAPHFHLSLQSGSDRILAKMKRKYNSAQAMRAIDLLRESIPNVKFTTDVIVGFPSETEDDLRATLDLVERARFLTVHAFPFSGRRGTPAATMPEQLSPEVKNARVHAVSDTAARVRRELLRSEIESGRTCRVLFETYRDGYAYGHSDDFLEVALACDSPLHGVERTVTLTHTDGEICFGRSPISNS